MNDVINKKQYLEHLLELSKAMAAAFKVGDVDMASELYDERERYMASVKPDDTEAPKDLVDQVLEHDQRVIAAALEHRHQMLASATHLNTVRGYASGLPTKLPGGDWGSG